jgi:hypothetical protein
VAACATLLGVVPSAHGLTSFLAVIGRATLDISSFVEGLIGTWWLRQACRLQWFKLSIQGTGGTRVTFWLVEPLGHAIGIVVVYIANTCPLIPLEQKLWVT